MRTRAMARGRALETVSIEPFDELDGQGAPSYDASQDIEALVKDDQTGRDDQGLVVDADGSEVRITLVLWVPGDESPLPNEQDRITRGGSKFIVLATRDVQRFNGTTDHVKAMLRDE